MATRDSSQLPDYKILLKDPAPGEHLRLLYGGKELNGTCLHVFNCLVVIHCISPSAFKTRLLSQADAFLLVPALLTPQWVGERIQRPPLFSSMFPWSREGELLEGAGLHEFLTLVT